jgi:hypothetical protein
VTGDHPFLPGEEPLSDDLRGRRRDRHSSAAAAATLGAAGDG